VSVGNNERKKGRKGAVSVRKNEGAEHDTEILVLTYTHSARDKDVPRRIGGKWVWNCDGGGLGGWLGSYSVGGTVTRGEIEGKNYYGIYP